jgi:polyferredoxin/ferredoxin
MRHARRLSQAFFLLLFLFLFIETAAKGADTLGYPVKLFLDFDPLLFLATLLSTHTLVKAFWLSLIVLAATAVLGRMFCGWICPLGTLNHMVGLLRKRTSRPRTPDWYRVKYVLLIFLLVSSLFTMQLAGLFDPLSLLIRSLSLGVYPAVNHGFYATFDALYQIDSSSIASIVDGVYGFLHRTVLAFQQPYFYQSAFITLLFLGILALNLVERRFWCRFLCPLGALLGLASRFALLKRSVQEDCTGCRLCEPFCQGGARPSEAEGWRPTECLYCWNCEATCPERDVRFHLSWKRSPNGVDLGRRRVLGAAAGGVAALMIFRPVPAFKPRTPNPKLIRPPGALKEPDFLAACVKCGECMKVCITNGLQPTLLEAGLEGIWSPVLVPRLGYCEYRCTLCGQVCPTGAIQRLSQEGKAKVRIGLAMIDQSRCLPWAHSVPCIVCEEVCPTPKKAVWFEVGRVKARDGRTVSLKRPRVDLDLCIGCGICETKCPVLGTPAIAVTSLGESRSADNQLLLG